MMRYPRIARRRRKENRQWLVYGSNKHLIYCRWRELMLLYDYRLHADSRISRTGTRIYEVVSSLNQAEMRVSPVDRESVECGW